jgi:hypothetical protein
MVLKADCADIDIVKEREAFIKWFNSRPAPTDRYTAMSAWIARAELHFLSSDNRLPENFATLIDALNALPENGMKLN